MRTETACSTVDNTANDDWDYMKYSENTANEDWDYMKYSTVENTHKWGLK
jgi:hypothetical protein